MWQPSKPPEYVTCPTAPADIADGEVITWSGDGSCSRSGAGRTGTVACPPLAEMTPAAPIVVTPPPAQNERPLARPQR